MSKFKVGDRVRRVAESTASVGCFGKVGVDYTIAAPASILSGDWRSECGIRISEDYFVLADTSPVRSVIRKEFVDGRFGWVEVRSLDGVANRRVGIKIGSGGDAVALSAPELTAAIATLTTIRDALDEVA